MNKPKSRRPGPKLKIFFTPCNASNPQVVWETYLVLIEVLRATVSPVQFARIKERWEHQMWLHDLALLEAGTAEVRFYAKAPPRVDTSG